MSRTSPIILGFAAVIITASAMPSCTPPSNPTVVNGTLRETATLDVSPYARVVVPDTVNIRIGEHLSRMEIHVEKELAFYGHPPHPMHIRKARDYLGVARREDDQVLLLGTYGEWSSIEGGARVRMDIVVPPGTMVEKRAGLSGTNSEAKPQNASDWLHLADSAEFRKCYWYTSISPGAGWLRIETTPLGGG